MNLPSLIVCMGVSGSGKSTLAQTLADALQWRFLEADDFHSPANRQRMAQGKPLRENHRKPWMAAVQRELEQFAQQLEPVVLAHSALRYDHREQLRNCGLKTRFLFLDGDFQLIEQRMTHRRGHYMPSSLLHSQYETLQRPEAEDDVLPMELHTSPEAARRAALAQLSGFLDEPFGK